MKLWFPWSRQRPAPAPAPPGDQREDRIAALLGAAGRIRYYRRRGLEPFDTNLSPPERLAVMPLVELEYFLRNPEDFYNWGTIVNPLRPLESPLANPGRVAVLEVGFRQSSTVQVFTGARLAELQLFDPETLAGPVNKLRTMASAAGKGRFLLPSLRNGIIPFTGLKYGFLSAEDRALFTKAFRAPVFEQFRGFSNELLAAECESHDGLHLLPENAIFETTPSGELLATCLSSPEYTLIRLATDLFGRLETGPCACGRTGLRLYGAKPKGAGETLEVYAAAAR